MSEAITFNERTWVPSERLDAAEGLLRDIADNFDHMDDGRTVGHAPSRPMPHPRFCAPCRAAEAFLSPAPVEEKK